jgi:hypothetical protein
MFKGIRAWTQANVLAVNDKRGMLKHASTRTSTSLLPTVIFMESPKRNGWQD